MCTVISLTVGQGDEARSNWTVTCGAVPTSERLETDLSEKTANLKAEFSEEINDDGEAEPENEPVRTVARGAAPTREKLETDLFEKWPISRPRSVKRLTTMTRLRPRMSQR